MVPYTSLYQERTSNKWTLATSNSGSGGSTSTEDGKTETKTSTTGTEAEKGSCFGCEKGCCAVALGEEETEFEERGQGAVYNACCCG